MCGGGKLPCPGVLLPPGSYAGLPPFLLLCQDAGWLWTFPDSMRGLQSVGLTYQPGQGGSGFPDLDPCNPEIMACPLGFGGGSFFRDFPILPHLNS